jgi:2-amino-4-hydroxy-6-hydroxymethyldihydropteridine diphosphokinase
MGEVIIHLGSNIEPSVNIRRGAELIAENLMILSSSHVWITPAFGAPGLDFYNAALLCSTNMNQTELKDNLLRPLEEQLGRIRTQDKYAARTIDMDIVFQNGIVLEPHLWDTAFILLPVAELLPELTHPKTGKSLQVIAGKIKPASGATQLPEFPIIII